ncbi:MarR family winged helix-turn-helix transcriptional regulator [Pseudactinotalea sp. Z1732]|uniref:MarR family winged helix-turn-helix transcriptional regulator n=1 Tax=Micrococcales TaxID=85006 RepID=UPI003C7D5B30
MNETGTRWLTPHQQQQWRAIQRGMALVTDRLDRDLVAAEGLSLHEYEVMVRLSEVPERRLRMSTLADQLVHSRSRLTHTVGRMEAKGLVSRCKADGDGRGVQCVLTDAGFERLAAAAPTHVASVRRRLVDVLDDDQLDALGAAFTRIAAVIEESTTTQPQPALAGPAEGVARG